MIAGHSGSKVLRSLDAPRSGFDRQPWNGDGRSGPSRIRVEHLIVNEDAARRIGCKDGWRRSYHRHLLLDGDDLLEAYGDVLPGARHYRDSNEYAHVLRRLGRDLVVARIHRRKAKAAVGATHSLGNFCSSGVLQLEFGAGHAGALRIDNRSIDAAGLSSSRRAE